MDHKTWATLLRRWFDESSDSSLAGRPGLRPGQMSVLKCPLGSRIAVTTCEPAAGPPAAPGERHRIVGDYLVADFEACVVGSETGMALVPWEHILCIETVARSR